MADAKAAMANAPAGVRQAMNKVFVEAQGQGQAKPSRDAWRVAVFMPDEALAMGHNRVDSRGSGGAPQSSMRTPTRGCTNATANADSSRVDNAIEEGNVSTRQACTSRSKQGTLIQALKRISGEQDDDAAAVADLEAQGDVKPQTGNNFWEWILQQTEPMVLVAMGDGPFVQPVHYIFRYMVPGRMQDQYHDQYLGTVREQAEEGNPAIVKQKKLILTGVASNL